MQTIQEVNAEQLAKLFHHYHEALQHDCDSQIEGCCSSWEQAPQKERKLMIAAARLALLELSTTPEAPVLIANTTRSLEKQTGAAKSKDWANGSNRVTG